MIVAKRPLMFFVVACAVLTATLFVPLFVASCSTLQAKDEAQALETLRRVTRGGNLPRDERPLTQIEADHRGGRAGALARFVRARIKLAAGDAAGAAQLLDAREIAERTAIGDYAQLLRGRAFEQAKRMVEARAAYEKLARDYPNSIRAREAALRNAELVLQQGAAAAVPLLLADLYQADDPGALLLTARAYERQSDASKAPGLTGVFTLRSGRARGRGSGRRDFVAPRIKHLTRDRRRSYHSSGPPLACRAIRERGERLRTKRGALSRARDARAQTAPRRRPRQHAARDGRRGRAALRIGRRRHF
ncbi:MAG: tetratricopeptide repeat protein [Pyrinomonadaceae bacterium]